MARQGRCARACRGEGPLVRLCRECELSDPADEGPSRRRLARHRVRTMVIKGCANDAQDGVLPRALLINGTVGVGKTTVAAAVCELLVQRNVPNALIDVDGLRNAWPSPSQDPFNVRLALRNLASVTANYVEAGVTHVILAGVIETPDDRRAFEAALAMPLTVCRLQADPATIRERLARRHSDDEGALMWHLNRAPQLDAILDSDAVDDYSVDARTATPPELAVQVTRTVGWSA